MTDSPSSTMARGKNSKRNKSIASVGSKKNRTQSTTSAKFHQNVEGFNVFILAVTRLGKHGNEFTYHDLRKVYHKETQRQLTAEELNAIFSEKNLTKREIFELPRVKRFMTSMDGSMLCKFRLIADPQEFAFQEEDNDDIPPLMTASLESDVITQSTTSPSSSQRISPVNSHEKEVRTSNDHENTTEEIQSGYEKSENFPSQKSLAQQSTDDEGWASGKDTRSGNSSPISGADGKDEVDGDSKMDLEDEVFETDQRIAAGSDCVDGAVVTDVMVVEEAHVEQLYKSVEVSHASPVIATESLIAAFAAKIQSVADAKTVLPDSINASKYAKVHATPRSILSPPIPAERSTVISDELSSGRPIKKLIEKFDTAVNFGERKNKETDASRGEKTPHSPGEEELGGSHIDQSLSFQQSEQSGEAAVTNVVFRSTSTHSSIIAQGKEQLAEFVAEQEAKQKEETTTTANTTTDDTENAFCTKEQSSMSSLDREYFDRKTNKNDTLFAELGVRDSDGYQLHSGRSNSNESGPPSSEIITVIETTQAKQAEDVLRKRADSIESEGDVPYSLCSEDEAEPITMIDKTMGASQSAEQLSNPKKETKSRTVVVNVELDANAKRDEMMLTVKERICALQAELAKKIVPIAKVDSVDEKDEITTLGLSEELPHVALEARPSSQAGVSSGTIRRRQVRFMRGCCVVQ